MRAYFFGNFYLSSIQQGIQSAHVVSELSVKYSPGTPQANDYEEWANEHKTMILLNGGMASNLWDIVKFFKKNGNNFCWSWFCEEHDALEGSITSVGIILPEHIYEGASLARQGLLVPEDAVIQVGEFSENAFTKFECELMALMNSCRLAS